MMNEYPTVNDVLSVIFKALHEHYDATTDASSDLCIQYNIKPHIIDVHDAANNRHFTIEVLGEDYVY